MTASKKEADMSLMIGGDSIIKVNNDSDLLQLKIPGFNDEDSIFHDT